ncbi:MAG: EVE domain-containing protein [Pseudomonadota bacterium]
MQFCRGWNAPIRKFSASNGVVYYSPRERRGEGANIRAFTAIGRVRPGSAYHAEQSGYFRPWRRYIDCRPANDAQIAPLLGQLSFSRENPNWGWLMRQRFFEITQADFDTIANAMEM